MTSSKTRKRSQPRHALSSKTKKLTNAATVKKLVVKPVMTEAECAKKEGDFFNADNYSQIIGGTNIDVYYIDDSSETPDREVLLFKLRHGVIPDSLAVPAFGALKQQAKKLNGNRGAAAGKIKLKSLFSHINADNIVKRSKYRVFYKTKSGEVSKDHSSNKVRSNIIGYFDMPDRNLIGKGIKNPPQCRQTQFTRDAVDKWKLALPLIQKANDQFRALVPDRWKIQHDRASKTPDFQILDTAYSTVTINYNYRSANHKDAGDLEEGFGNLVVLEKNRCEPGTEIYGYDGGFLGFPRFGIAVDVRQGDYLAMNVHEWHANTALICKCPKGEKCKDEAHYGRLSLVCYLRKNMIVCAKSGHHN